MPVAMDTIQSYNHHIYGQLITKSHDLIPVQLVSELFLSTLTAEWKINSQKLQIRVSIQINNISEN